MIRRPPRSTLFPLHDALPIFPAAITFYGSNDNQEWEQLSGSIPVSWDLWNKYAVLQPLTIRYLKMEVKVTNSDRKSTRLNSSHANISYAVFCLKKKNKT